MSTLLHQLRFEQKVFWRSREAAVFIFIFPLLLYALLGSVYGDEIDGVPAVDVLLAGLFGYGAANTAFAGLAIILVGRREAGVLKRLRATPLTPAVYLAAVLLSTLATFALQSVSLLALGGLAFGASMPANWLGFAGAIVLGVACFAGLGLAAAALIRSAEGVSAVVNVVVLPDGVPLGRIRADAGLPGRPAGDRRRAPAHVLHRHRRRRLPRRRLVLRRSEGTRDRARVGPRGCRRRPAALRLDAPRALSASGC